MHKWLKIDTCAICGKNIAGESIKNILFTPRGAICVSHAGVEIYKSYDADYRKLMCSVEIYEVIEK